MNLIEENFQSKEEKKKKNNKTLRTIILSLMILIILLIFGIVGYLYYLEQSKLTLSLNNQENDKLKNLLLIEADGSIYLPVKQVASYFGYESFNGEYTDKSESQSKCYVQSENEVTNITLGSNKLYKLDLTRGLSEYEYVYAKEPIKSVNGVLYAPSETAEEIFNISFNYNKDKNRIDIYTTPYLVEAYSKTVLDYGYAELSNLFVNQKAILDGVLVVKNEKGKYGVLNLDGNVILEAKYDDIEYLPYAKDLLVKSNGKVGIMSQSAQIKVDINYDEIKIMDSDSELYVVRKDNKYGVMDFKGNIKVYIENDEIGIDTSKFTQNNVKNKYLLVDNLIPVRREKYWGLFNKKGQQVVEFKYDALGCTASTRDGINLLIIPDYNVLVAEKDRKYTLLNSEGKELFDTIADSIYMEVTGGEKYYYIEFNGNKINAIDWLEQNGVKAKNNSDEKEDNSENTNATNTNSTNTTANTNNANVTSESDTNTTEEDTNSNEEQEYNQDENSDEQEDVQIQENEEDKSEAE